MGFELHRGRAAKPRDGFRDHDRLRDHLAVIEEVDEGLPHFVAGAVETAHQIDPIAQVAEAHLRKVLILVDATARDAKREMGVGVVDTTSLPFRPTMATPVAR